MTEFLVVCALVGEHGIGSSPNNAYNRLPFREIVSRIESDSFVIRQRDIEHASMAAGIAPEVVIDLAPRDVDIERLKAWQSNGHAGELLYMQREPELLTSPRLIMPAARSMLCFAFPYEARSRVSIRPRLSGRVARYAWGRDYHKVIKKKLQRFVVALSEVTSFQSRIFSDAVPLLERAFAARAKLGFVGKNTMLIQARGRGSFFFIGEILLDQEVETVADSLTVLPDGKCGNCFRCGTNCPTEAFVSPHILDAKKCISYLTIEKRGSLTQDERNMVGEWIFGCDVCQEVCPFNHRALTRESDEDYGELSADCGVGPYLSLQQILRIRTNHEFEAQFAGTALMRAKREGLLRNAAVVAGNMREEAAWPLLQDAFFTDNSAQVRQHALWGIFRLRNAISASEWNKVFDTAVRDPDESVVVEARRLVESEPS